METKNLLFSKPYLDIIFEKRNQEYGAYILRKEYERNIGIAIFTTLSIIVLAMVANFTWQYFHPTKPFQLTNGEHTFTEVPLPEVIETPKPPKGRLPKPPTEATTMIVVENTEQELTQDSIPESLPLAYNDSGNDGALGTPDGEEGGTGIIPSTPTLPPAIAPPSIVNFAEEMPEFIGGESAMMEFIRTHVEYPYIEQENGMSGMVAVSFVVNEDGSVSNVEGIKSTTNNFKKASEKVVAQFPKFKPGRQGGRAVKVRMSIPIKFVAH